jgi:cytochrome c553
MLLAQRSRRAVAALALMASLTAASDRAVAGDGTLGEYLSSECVTCHQPTGRYDGIRPIIGWPEAVFIEVMDEFRARKRDNLIMQTIAGRLSAEEIAALAAYFGSLQPRVK